MLRPLIALVLPALAVLAGGCDRQSPDNGQAAAPPAQGAPLAEAGAPDRSHAGEAAPTLAFALPDGTRRTLADFRGTPVLVNLWATWCAPCKAEMPTLDALAVREKGRLAVLTISQDLNGAEAVQPYFAAQRFRALQPWLDPQLGWSTGVSGNLPTTLLYDANGREVWRITGGLDWTGARATALIDEGRRPLSQ